MTGLETALCCGNSTSIDGASISASYRRGDRTPAGAVTGRSRSNEISFLSWLYRFLGRGRAGSTGWPNTRPLAAAAMAVPVPMSCSRNRLDKIHLPDNASQPGLELDISRNRRCSTFAPVPVVEEAERCNGRRRCFGNGWLTVGPIRPDGAGYM